MDFVFVLLFFIHTNSKKKTLKISLYMKSGLQPSSITQVLNQSTKPDIDLKKIRKRQSQIILCNVKYVTKLYI